MPKFIHWVPTQPEFIDTFFDLCPVSSSDIVYDLGSGDGRLLFAALEKGAAKCVGIDIDPSRVKVAVEAARSRGVEGRVTFIESDVMEVDLSEASVILCYLYYNANIELRPKFEKELKAGTRVVMESFPVPGWQPVKEAVTGGRNFYFYTMPPERTAEYDQVLTYPEFPYWGLYNHYG